MHRYYEFEDFRIDTRRRILEKGGVPVPVSARIFDLLLVFVQNEGRLLDHNELLDKVWGGAFVEQSNLKKSVSSLRQTLGENPNDAVYIKTVPRSGYIFVAEVRTVGEEAAMPASAAIERSLAPENLAAEAGAARFGGGSPDKAETRRHRRSLLVFAAVFIGVAVFSAAGYFLIARFGHGRTADRVRLENIRMTKLTTSGNIVRATLGPDGKSIAYATFDSAGRQSLWVRRLGQNSEVQLLPPEESVYTTLAVSPDGNFLYYTIARSKANEALYRISMSGGPPRKIAEQPSSDPAFSPDGRRVAFVRDTDGIRRLLIVNAEDGGDEREIYSVTDLHKLIDPRWSPDGRRFVFIASDVTEKGRVWSLAEIPAEGGPVRSILPPQSGKIFTPNWLGDGSGIVYCAELPGTRQTQIWRLDARSGDVARLTNDVASYENVVPSADGRTFIATQSEKIGDIWSLSLSLLQNSTRITNSQSFVGGFAQMPDGRLLADHSQNGQNGLQFIKSDGSQPLPLFTESNGERTAVMTPDGSSILFVSRRSGSQEIWRADADGRNPRQLSDEKTWVTLPHQTHDGSTIYFTKYDGARWRLVKMPATGGPATDVLPDRVNQFAISPDGRQYAYSFLSDERRRWMAAVRNMSDNSLVREFDIDPISFLEWLPDGRGFLYNASETFRDGGDLMLQPIDGGAPKKLLQANEDRVFFAAPAGDNRILMTRGKTISNIVVLTRDQE